MYMSASLAFLFFPPLAADMPFFSAGKLLLSEIISLPFFLSLEKQPLLYVLIPTQPPRLFLVENRRSFSWCQSGRGALISLLSRTSITSEMVIPLPPPPSPGGIAAAVRVGAANWRVYIVQVTKAPLACRVITIKEMSASQTEGCRV